VVRLRVKYIGADYVALPIGTIREVIAVENGWYRIMTELGEDYLFPKNLFEIVDGSEADITKKS
jgi:hypothetical protein